MEAKWWYLDAILVTTWLMWRRSAFVKTTIPGTTYPTLAQVNKQFCYPFSPPPVSVMVRLDNNKSSSNETACRSVSVANVSKTLNFKNSAVRCGEPMLPEYPGVTIIGKPEDYRFNGPTVQYSCVRGYTLVNDPGIQTTIFCSSEGKWSNADDYDLPACDRE